MQQVVVSVGPLAAGSANAIALSQTPTAGTILLSGTPVGGSGVAAFKGTASITGNVMTVTATASGGMSVGQQLSGLGVAGGTVVTGPGPAANTWIVSPAQTVGSETIWGGALITLDQARQVLITTTEAAKNFAITGTDWAGNPISEVIAATGANVTSVLSYKTISQITISANAAGALTVGTNGVAYSPWVRFDEFAAASITKQCVGAGTVNYTVQITMDDPNRIPNPVALAAMTWDNDPDAQFVGQSASAMGNWSFAPIFARVLLNSGTGAVTATFTQMGVVTQ